MADPINAKPFSTINFNLAAGGQQQYETSQGAVIYFAEGPGIAPGEIRIQFDEYETFRAAVGLFVRVQRFDKLRIYNDAGGSRAGVIYVSTDPDFLMLMEGMGI